MAASDNVQNRCGQWRNTMNTNPLIVKSDVGQITRTTFSSAKEGIVFGNPNLKDPENAKEVTMTWKAHQPNPDDKPGPDFKAMNKHAAVCGLTSAKDQQTYRSTHKVTMRKGESLKKPPPPLPSTKDSSFTYGQPSRHRTAEVVRAAGPVEPRVKELVQGAFAGDWVAAHEGEGGQSGCNRSYIKPGPTRATEGHALGAQETIRSVEAGTYAVGDPWKMSKFTHVPSRVTQYMGGRTDKTVGEAELGETAAAYKP